MDSSAHRYQYNRLPRQGQTENLDGGIGLSERFKLDAFAKPATETRARFVRSQIMNLRADDRSKLL